MKINNLYSISLLVSLLNLVQCLEMTFYGTKAEGNRPSESQAPACGDSSEFITTDYFVAMNQDQFEASKTGSSSYSAKVCGRCIRIIYKNKYCVGKIVDSCPGCNSNRGVDVSPYIFEKLESLDVGRIYDMDWEFLDSCSTLGQHGTCSGKCTLGSSSSSSSNSKTTNKTTNSTNKATKVKSAGGSIPTNIVVDGPTIKTNNTQILNNGTIVELNDNAENKNKNNNKTQKTKLPSSSDSSTKKGKDEDEEEEEEEDSSNYALPITGAVAFSCAAGIGLVYAKRNSSGYEEIKQKFPEAFGNLKRSLTRGSSNLRRGLSRSGTALRRKMSGRNSMKSRAAAAAAIGSSVRTKAEYRNSLDAHYNFNYNFSNYNVNNINNNNNLRNYNNISNNNNNNNMNYYNKHNSIDTLDELTKMYTGNTNTNVIDQPEPTFHH